MRVLHTGGAAGADEYFSNLGTELGFSVIVSTFKGHKTKSEGLLSLVTEDDLIKADTRLIQANKRLKRQFPTNSDYTNNLLRRNYFIIRSVDAIYAVGMLTDGIPEGGTAWGCQMGLDLGKIVYFFDQDENSWFILDNTNPPLSIPMPKLEAKFAGIGTRTLNENGRQAINDLLKQ